MVVSLEIVARQGISGPGQEFRMQRMIKDESTQVCRKRVSADMSMGVADTTTLLGPNAQAFSDGLPIGKEEPECTTLLDCYGAA